MCVEDLFHDSSYAKTKINFEKNDPIFIFCFFFFLLETNNERSLCEFHVMNIRGGKIVVSFGICHIKVIEKYASAFPVEKKII